MEPAFFKTPVTLRRDPRVRHAAETLGVTRPQIIGHLEALWCWVVPIAPSGCLDGGYRPEDLAEGADWDGDPGEFLGALVEAGLLTRVQGGWSLPDWDQRYPLPKKRQRTSAQKQADKEYQAKRRTTKRASGEAGQGELPLDPSHASHSATDPSHRLEERRGEEKREEGEEIARAREGPPVSEFSDEERRCLSHIVEKGIQVKDFRDYFEKRWLPNVPGYQEKLKAHREREARFRDAKETYDRLVQAEEEAVPCPPELSWARSRS